VFALASSALTAAKRAVRVLDDVFARAASAGIARASLEAQTRDVGTGDARSTFGIRTRARTRATDATDATDARR